MSTPKTTPPRPSGFWRQWKTTENPRLKERYLGQFVQANEGFARFVVERMRRDGAARGCDKEDLMQAARLGLIEAAHRWEPERGRFTTYAWWRVRLEVQKAITKDMPLRGPAGAKAKGKPRPERAPMRRSQPAPSRPPSALEHQDKLELAQALLEDLTAAEKRLLFGENPANAEAKEALLCELWGYFDE